MAQHVWVITHPEYPDSRPMIFEKEEHLERSVQISYHKCKDVVIKREPRDFAYDVCFTVTGLRSLNATEWERFEDKVKFMSIPIYTEPSHL